MSKEDRIIVHCLVKNESRFIWYSLKSVLPYVDKVMIWDTGSTDATVEIIKTIDSPKIEFKEVGSVTTEQFTQVRQQMLDQTPKSFDWLMILDGDEIWPKNSIKKVIDFIKKDNYHEAIIVRSNNLVGDIYHRLPKSAGKYHFAEWSGHLALRFVNLKRIPGLHVDLPHGQQGYFDNQDTLIQHRDFNKIKYIRVPYHHATHLLRSTATKDKKVPKRNFKFKYETGETIPSPEIPEVFWIKRPRIVAKVTAPATRYFKLRSAMLTPLRRLKRLLINEPSGYLW